MFILIPAYEPDMRLLELVVKVKAECGYPVIIVDDGSGKAYHPIFDMARKYGCTVLTHIINQGKGRALKTGFDYIRKIGGSEGVVCADCDGQHQVKDIIRVAKQIESYPRHIVLGCRRFTGKVPLRSQFGNTVTRTIFSFITGEHVYDTQTGLRGYSADMLDWLCTIPGERFEYEINMLLKAMEAGYSFHEVDIETLYHNKNKSSHFHTIRDSARVYLPILKFCTSSVLSAVIDFALLLFIRQVTSSLFLAVVGARVCSSVFNYIMNKFFVFSQGRRSEIKESAIKYFTLVIVIMLLNYGFMYTFNILMGIPLLLAKVFTETVMFMFSYWSQRKFVFKSGRITGKNKIYTSQVTSRR